MRNHDSGLQRLFNILFGPNPSIKDKAQRQQSILLSSFQLAMIPIAVLTIITGDLLNNVELLVVAAIVAILATYLITRILNHKASVALVIRTLYPVQGSTHLVSNKRDLSEIQPIEDLGKRISHRVPCLPLVYSNKSSSYSRSFRVVVHSRPDSSLQIL